MEELAEEPEPLAECDHEQVNHHASLCWGMWRRPETPMLDGAMSLLTAVGPVVGCLSGAVFTVALAVRARR